MAQSAVAKNFRDGSIAIADATGTPIEVTIAYEPGDFSISGLNESNTEVTTYLDRGELGSVRKTNRVFPTGSFTCWATDLSDGTDKLPADAVQKLGAFAAGVSTLGANADVFTTKITLTVEGTDFGDSADHTLVLDDCHTSVDFSEGDPNQFTVNFTVYGTVTWT